MIASLIVSFVLWGLKSPQAGNPVVPMAPSFSVVDLNQVKVTESQFKGKVTVLFAFCGCRECRLVAERWAQMESQAKVGGTALQVFACYSGNAFEVKSFAKAWPGDKSKTRFLIDPKLSIATAFQALPCPAAFVIDAQGRLRYSSKLSAGELETDAEVILNQVFDTFADIKSGRTVLSAPKAPEGSSPLVVVETTVNRRLNDSTFQHLITAARSKQEQMIERRFEFRNPTKKPVHIDSVVSSCGCNDAGFLVKGELMQATTITPGSKALVRVRLKVAPNFEGQKSVQVWLMLKGAPVPYGCIQLEVHGA